MMCMFFNEGPVYDYDTAVKSNTGMYEKYFKEMIKRGIYLPPSQFETFFLSTAHTDIDIEKTIKASFEAGKCLKM